MDYIIEDDEQILGLHLLLHHKLIERKDFNETYTFDILKTCTPDRLRFNEQFFIDHLKTLWPRGLNMINSISGA